MADKPYKLWREQADAAAPFTVCAMFTPDYRHQAERLAASLAPFALAHALFEVPQIHRSISARGGGDIATSKPRFIRFTLEHFAGPVLYVDADMVFRKAPQMIAQLCGEGHDFAVYNWLADEMNDAWRPEADGRHWKFFFSVDLASPSQLMASGGVQLWRRTDAAFALLADWETALLNHPRSEDDHCLDFAYNHGERSGLKPAWLPKAYCRCAFWPYADPVIDHPEFPAPVTGHFEQLGSARLDTTKIARAKKRQPFPRQAILDARAGQLLMPDTGGRYVPAGPLPGPLYSGNV